MNYFWVSVVAILSVAVSSADEQLPWWKTAVLYQVYPRSFKDSDGDGVGDLKGVAQMADYFKDIGVDAIWLSPIYASPMADFGYDISNFIAIDPIFGTMDDFDALVAKLKSIDIKLVLDFVPNHSSDEHPWFQKSVNNNTYPDYSDFYIWKDPMYNETGSRIPPNNWISEFAGPAWEWNEERQQYYFHAFLSKQPDLNYRNPYVMGNMTDVINFWLDKGIDGFRMDAVQHLFENQSFPDDPPVPGTAGNTFQTLQHIYDLNQPETHDLLKYWASVVSDRVQKDGRKRVIILEVYDVTSVASTYYGTDTESLEFPFNFNLLTYGNKSTRSPYIKSLIDDWIKAMPNDGVANWAVGNHDNNRVADRYGSEMVDVINILTCFLPGIKVTYYGEEIGMRDTYVRWDQTVDPSGRNLGPEHYMDAHGTRDPERSPMQWDDSASAGFSSNETTWLPVNPNYWWLNVKAQRAVKNSHLNVFKTLLKARKDPVLQKGDLKVLAPDSDTLVVVRSYNGSYFALLINMGSITRSYTSQNLFAPYGLDINMTVVVSSINTIYSPGLFLQRGSLSVTLRPKSAVMLKSGSSPPSPTNKGSLTLSLIPLLCCCVITVLRL